MHLCVKRVHVCMCRVQECIYRSAYINICTPVCVSECMCICVFGPVGENSGKYICVFVRVRMYMQGCLCVLAA